MEEKQTAPELQWCKSAEIREKHAEPPYRLMYRREKNGKEEVEVAPLAGSEPAGVWPPEQVPECYRHHLPAMEHYLSCTEWGEKLLVPYLQELPQAVLDLLDERNGPQADRWHWGDFRVYYVLDGKNIVNSFAISKSGFPRLKEASQMANRLFSLMYGKNGAYSLEYSGQTQNAAFDPAEYTSQNLYLPHAPSLYLL